MSNQVADMLFAYLKEVIYDPSKAFLHVDNLPDDFKDLGKGLQYFCSCILETNLLAKELSKGNLDCEPPSRGNELAAPLKMLHSSLRHLTWQAQQVAKGDYKQRVEFMGDFSEAFNNMIVQLSERWETSIDEKEKLQTYMNLMLNNSADPILVFDSELNLVYASTSFLQYQGIANEGGIVGRHFYEFFKDHVSEEFIERINQIFYIEFKSKSPIETALDLDFVQSGNKRNYRMRVSPMFRSNAKFEGIIVILYDMTEIIFARKEAERAREIAEQSSYAKSEFLARISHEMRTPMNAIRGMAEIYSKSSELQKKDYCVQKIDEASASLIEIINSILDMSEFEAGTMKLSPKKCEIKKIADFTVSKLRPYFVSRNQKLSINFDADLPETIMADETRLIQVLESLLSNAIKYSGDNTKIDLFIQTVFKNGKSMIKFSISDNGIGISKEDQKRLFIPFEQLDGTSTRKAGGMGLGLAICKRIVELMGGEIGVESTPDEGSTFFFFLPDTEKNEVQTNDFAKEIEIGGNEDGIFKGHTILIVDDIEINREIVIALLEHTGIKCEAAIDGAEAVEKFINAPDLYGLIFMDINMPVMDGYRATTRIRNSNLSRAKTIPIIAMTSNTFSEDIEKCLAFGINSHIAKPIDINLVIACLKEYLK